MTDHTIASAWAAIAGFHDSNTTRLDAFKEADRYLRDQADEGSATAAMLVELADDIGDSQFAETRLGVRRLDLRDVIVSTEGLDALPVGTVVTGMTPNDLRPETPEFRSYPAIKAVAGGVTTWLAPGDLSEYQSRELMWSYPAFLVLHRHPA